MINKPGNFFFQFIHPLFDRATSLDCCKFELTSMVIMTSITLSELSKLKETMEKLPANPILVISAFDKRKAEIHPLT